MTTTVAATKAASSSEDVWCRPDRNGITRAARSPAATPRYIASPPVVGVGLGWTLRSEGWSIQPNRNARRRTTGVTTKVTPALTANTRRYGRTLWGDATPWRAPPDGATGGVSGGRRGTEPPAPPRARGSRPRPARRRGCGAPRR